MKERPIIFSGPMIMAILRGQKTQTRRVMKPQLTVNGVRHHKWERPDVIDRCPYGKAEDRLWARETWRAAPGSMETHYSADGDEVSGGPWSSPIHMPRSRSRVTLEIITVTVERLQEISKADIRAEGIDEAFCEALGESAHRDPDLLEAWCHGWDKLNAKRGYGWDTNPWVWVIEFKKL